MPRSYSLEPCPVQLVAILLFLAMEPANQANLARELIAPRVKHLELGAVARVTFAGCCCRFLALASGVHSRFVECIYLSMVFRYKSNMHRLGIRLSFFEPEKRLSSRHQNPSNRDVRLGLRNS